MKTLNLGSNFDTSNVTSMRSMFMETGYTEMESLDLGDKFNVDKVEEMYSMFKNTGYSKLTLLDLGPMFRRIPSGYVSQTTDMLPDLSTNKEVKTNIPAHNGYDGMFDGTGKTKEIKIQASEQIYFDKNNFKLNTDATSSTINYTRGTINPKYRTEWLKEASTLTIDDSNLKNSKITVTLRGRTNAEAGKDFTSNVTSSLTADKIHVYFDGVESTTVSKSIATTVVAKNAITGANDVTQVLTISGLDDTRKDGKTYTEWSGNISLKIDKKTLKDDTYNNQNLSAIDTSGTMENIVIKETENISANTTGTMFADYIRPEFTYEYSNTNIDYDKKNVTVVFDITDKYFKESAITLDNTTIQVDGVEPDWTKVTRTFGKKTLDADQTVGDITYKANGDIYTTINGKQQK